MKHFSMTCALAFGVAATATTALAQYTGPTSAPAPAVGGPAAIPLMSAKQVIESGRDDQHVRIQGRIVSHDGGKNYTFADDSGRLPVEISAKRFPVGQPINADQRVELVGEIDKDLGKMEFEVEQVRLLP
jgi:uncharacterized protein (TIGR00156 family)